MVGTASSTVTRSRRIRSIAFAGSKRAISESPAPAAIAAFIAHVIPNTWNSGRQASTTSSSVSFKRRRTGTFGPVGRSACEAQAPDERLGVGVGQVELHLAALHQRVHRHHDGAEP